LLLSGGGAGAAGWLVLVVLVAVVEAADDCASETPRAIEPSAAVTATPLVRVRIRSSPASRDIAPRGAPVRLGRSG
jgi:hypothetical protein